MTKDLYKQVELQYKDGSHEVCWIPQELAVEKKLIFLKQEQKSALVVKAYPTPATLEQIDINRRHPLRKATDI